MFPYVLLEEAGAVHEIGRTLSAAGDTAGTVFVKMPVFITRIAMCAVVLFAGIVMIRLGVWIINKTVRARGQLKNKTVRQINTIRTLTKSVYRYVMYFIILALILSVFGVKVSSLLALAGVSGVAIGFGAQTLVQDIISGIFLWVEGSIAVGDVVTINDRLGTIESIAIRTTVIRCFDGNVVTIPNGEIRTITNISRDYKRAIVDVRCPYDADLQAIIDLLKSDMLGAATEIIGLTEVPEVLGVIQFDPDAIIVRVAGKCLIGEHWRIERELRLRIKTLFDREGIVMPHYQKPVVQ